MSSEIIRFFPGGGAITISKAAWVQRVGKRVRASHVEPANPIIRWLFHLIRGRVSDNSYLAEFTRSWRCRWRARIFEGPTLGPYKAREIAIDAEVSWIICNCIMEGLDETSEIPGKTET